MNKYPTLYIQNFGKIKEAEIEVAPFTLFIGHNNSGKSYLSSLIWYIFSFQFIIKYSHFKDIQTLEHLYSLTDEIFYNSDDNFSEIKINNDVIYDCIKLLNDTLEKNKNSILKDIFNSDNISIDKLHVKIFDINKNMIIKYKKNYDDFKENEIILISFHNNKYNFPINSCNGKESVLKLLYIRILESLFEREFSNTLFIPISRTGFLLLKDAVINESLSNYFNNNYYSNIHNSPTLIKPIQDFFFRLSALRGTFGSINNNSILSIIEKNIIDGELVIIDEPNMSFLYKSSNDLVFPIYLTSAVISELAPLTFFLKYSNSNEDIIIEEPEISLHPNLQQQLTRVFIKLVNKRRNILITTHSDTIIQHINNMIKLNANKEDRKKELLEKYKYDDDDLISTEYIRMYQFDIDNNGKTNIKKLELDDYGFRTPTFHNYLLKVSDEFDDFIEEL